MLLLRSSSSWTKQQRPVEMEDTGGSCSSKIVEVAGNTVAAVAAAVVAYAADFWKLHDDADELGLL